jgi:hypothetical protein
MKFQKFSKSRACPVCQNTEVFRLKRVGFATRLVSKISNYRPHWCSNCDTFFFAPKRAETSNLKGQYGMTSQEKANPKQPHAGGPPH